MYDGHGGIDAANYAASQLLIHLKSSPATLIQQPGDALHKAIMKTDEEFVKKAKREVRSLDLIPIFEYENAKKPYQLNFKYSKFCILQY